MEDIIHWVTEHKDESPPKRKVNHSHPDPTANEAIGNVIREERRKNRPKKNRPRIRVWRAEEAKPDAGK